MALIVKISGCEMYVKNNIMSSYTNITYPVHNAGAECVDDLAVLPDMVLATFFKAAGNSFNPRYTYVLTTVLLLR
jgi:hypothetical protein